MEPIVEHVRNPEGQSFYALHSDNSQPCKQSYWHMHEEYELVYVKNGNGRLQVGDYYSTYTDGILIFLGPNIPHMPFTNFDYPDNEEVVVQFKETLIIRQLAEFPEFQKVLQLCRKSHSGLLFDDRTQKHIGSAMLGITSLPGPLRLCKLLEVLIRLSENSGYEILNVIGMNFSGRQNDYNRMNIIYDFVADNFKNDIRISDVADKVGLTPNSFCRFFKKINQKSFVQFVNEFRINKSVELMTAKNLSISQIMFESGYNDPSYFNKQFRKLKGESPSQYRSMISNN